MRRLFILVAIAIGFVACSRNMDTDIPSVSFSQDIYAVSRDGGEVIIPVRSTGVDNVTITYPNGDMWEVDPDTGDMTPSGWITLVKVINDYKSETRALLKRTSGLCLEIEPNDTDYERTATITVSSFTAEASITVRQGF